MKHKRVIVTHYGGSDALQVVEEECPEPKAGEVRVKVLAAGVSLPDIMAREGEDTRSGEFTLTGTRATLQECLSIVGFEDWTVSRAVTALPSRIRNRFRDMRFHGSDRFAYS